MNSYLYIHFQIFRREKQEDTNNKGIVFASVMKEREKKEKKVGKRANEGTNTQYMEFGTNISVLAKQFQQCVRQRVIIG